GKIQVNGSGTTLKLDTDVVENGTGTVQVDLNAELDLASSTIHDGSVTNAGLIKAISGNNIIANVNDDLAGPEVFTNTGKIQVNGDNTKLMLDTDVLTNTGGTVQVDVGSVPGTNDPTLELKSAEIDNGSITNAGLIKATSGTSTIANVNDDG